ncbi:MAG: 5-(carboxyamino)imidazole ribonucleotide mutase [Bacillota bacterium]
MSQPLVAIVMGSDSDLPVMRETAAVLEELHISFEVSIASAHRTPEAVQQLAAGAASRGIRVIIAGAGGAAHLPGIIAAHTTLPVIGVPISVPPFNGTDALYSIVQMPRGIPVAAMAVNGARNAGIFAAQILALENGDIYERLIEFKQQLAEKVEEKNKQLQQLGVDGYLFETGKK